MYTRVVLSLGIIAMVSAVTPIYANAADKSANRVKSLEQNEKGVAAVNARNYKKAEELFGKALAIDSGNLTAVYNLSAMYMRNKESEKAIALLSDYTKRYDKDAGLFARLGDAWMSQRKMSNAYEAYEKAYAIDPKHPRLAMKLGTIHVMLKQLDKAEQMYLLAVELEPKDAQILSNLSSVFLANGKPDKAISTAKRGLAVNPSSPLYITMGSAYEALKDNKNALIAFERARDLGDESEKLEAKIAEVKKSLS